MSGNPVLVEAKDWNALLTRLEVLEALSLLDKEPDYDSDWFALASGSTTKTHSLGSTHLLIQVYGNETGSEGIMNHRVGGIGGGSGFRGGYYTNVTTTQITVTRESGDTLWDEFRILLWVLS